MNTFATWAGSRAAIAVVIGQAVAHFVGVLNGSCSTGKYAAESQTSVAKQVAISERQQALTLRAAWMRRMGLAETEIETFCKDDGGPVDLQEELDNLSAARELKQITPSYGDLKVLVDRVAPSKMADGKR